MILKFFKYLVQAIFKRKEINEIKAGLEDIANGRVQKFKRARDLLDQE